VVMTRDEAIGAFNEVFVVLAPTTIRDLPTEVRLGTEDGMPRERVLDSRPCGNGGQGFIGDRITTLSAEKLHSVCRALDVATGCGRASGALRQIIRTAPRPDWALLAIRARIAAYPRVYRRISAGISPVPAGSRGLVLPANRPF
jgi:mRNA-degrading endonuclease toxin of MazEF toxin-antitoxin module